MNVFRFKKDVRNEIICTEVHTAPNFVFLCALIIGTSECKNRCGRQETPLKPSAEKDQISLAV